jgi:hypothetical protein
MAKSYSGSRYKDDFTVARQDAEHLYQKVASFLLLSKTMCYDKIAMLDHEAAVYAGLKNTEALQITFAGASSRPPAIRQLNMHSV